MHEALDLSTSTLKEGHKTRRSTTDSRVVLSYSSSSEGARGGETEKGEEGERRERGRDLEKSSSSCPSSVLRKPVSACTQAIEGWNFTIAQHFPITRLTTQIHKH